MANVFTLVPPPPTPPSDPAGDVIGQLELLLDLARQGSITSFAYIAVGDPETAPAAGWSGEHRNAMLAGLPMLTDALVWKRVDTDQ
jgi:hypothetical protein